MASRLVEVAETMKEIDVGQSQSIWTLLPASVKTGIRILVRICGAFLGFHLPPC